MKQIFEDCKRVEIEDNGNKAFKTINIIRKHGISVKIDISYARLKGEWIKWNFKTFGALGDWEYKCSNCEKVYDGEYNFCPNCGADMRKGEKE